MSSGEISRADLSDEDIAELRKYKQLERENRTSAAVQCLLKKRAFKILISPIVGFASFWAGTGIR